MGHGGSKSNSNSTENLSQLKQITQNAKDRKHEKKVLAEAKYNHMINRRVFKEANRISKFVLSGKLTKRANKGKNTYLYKKFKHYHGSYTCREFDMYSKLCKQYYQFYGVAISLKTEKHYGYYGCEVILSWE